MPTLAWHLEEPRVGQSYPNFYAAKLASKFVKVVLSGAGGDELFGGYPWRYYRAVVNDDFDDYVDKYYGSGSAWSTTTELQADVRADLERRRRRRRRATSSATSSAITTTALAAPEDYINHSLYFECKTFLHGLLVVEDKLSMAHGLETPGAVPRQRPGRFRDALPGPPQAQQPRRGRPASTRTSPATSRRNSSRRPRTASRSCATSWAASFPTEVTQAEKQGFSAPDASWFKGESIDFVRERLLRRQCAASTILLDEHAVQELVSEHLDGEQQPPPADLVAAQRRAMACAA